MTEEAQPSIDSVRFSYRGKVYVLKDVDEVPMRHLLELQQQTAEFGRMLTAGEIEEMSDRLGKLHKDERKKDPDAMWMTAISLWISMRLAGDEITFGEVIDIPMSQIKALPAVSDRKRPAADPTTRPTRKATGGAAKPRKRAAGRSSART